MTPSRIVGTTGIAAITAALTYVFTLLSNPDYLSDLLVAIQTHQDPSESIVKLVAAMIGLIGAIVCTCVAFWLAHSPLATFTVTETHTTEMKGSTVQPIPPPAEVKAPTEPS